MLEVLLKFKFTLPIKNMVAASLVGGEGQEKKKRDESRIQIHTHTQLLIAELDFNRKEGKRKKEGRGMPT